MNQQNEVIQNFPPPFKDGQKLHEERKRLEALYLGLFVAAMRRLVGSCNPIDVSSASGGAVALS